MTDQPTPDTAATTPQSMPQTLPLGAVPITILAQYVKDLSFENPNAPQSLSQLGPSNQPQVGVSVNIQTGQVNAPTPAGQPAFECALTIKAEGKLNQGDTPQTAFIVEVTFAGLFAFPANMPEPAVRALLMVEAPRLLFPFARMHLSEAAQSGGYGPLLINPIDFGGLYQQQLNYEAQASQQQSGTA